MLPFYPLKMSVHETFKAESSESRTSLASKIFIKLVDLLPNNERIVLVCDGEMMSKEMIEVSCSWSVIRLFFFTFR